MTSKISKRIIPSLVGLALAQLLVGESQLWGQGQKVFRRLPASDYQKAFDELWPQGYRPTRIGVQVLNGVDYYDLEMERPQAKVDCHAHHLLSDSAFLKKQRDYSKRGFKMYIHEAYVLRGSRRHVAAWSRPSLNRPLGSVWKSTKDVPVTGNQVSGLKPVDDMMVKFLSENQIPGATIAISKGGQVVYSRGFGYSDLEAQTRMKPDTLMRIASVSKPVTAAAVMKLVSQGKLQLDDRVFSKSKVADPRLQQVTIEQLLRHRAGWDRKRSFDPMFRHTDVAKFNRSKTPVQPREIIKYMMARKLDFNPGHAYAYSNFGYAVLGREIERVSGMPYEAYVQQQILAPLGIDDMKVGRTLLEHRTAQESRYYPRDGVVVNSIFPNVGPEVPSQYGGWCLETMDAHGGWIASSADLVRFASAFDRPDRCPLMTEESARQMFVPDDLGDVRAGANGVKRYYGYGWQIVKFANGRLNSFHTGLLDGTQAILVRRNDGFNWAVLFNTDKNLQGKHVAGLVDPLVHQAVNAVTKWP